MSISSNTSICLKLQTTSILYMSSVTEAHWSLSSAVIKSYPKNRPCLSSGNSSMLFKSSTNTTSCIEISSLIIFSLATVSWNLEILDSAKVWKRQIWQRPCWDHLSIWHLRFLGVRSIAQRLIFGLLELSSTKCSMATAPFSQQPSRNWYRSWNKLSSNFQTLNQ